MRWNMEELSAWLFHLFVTSIHTSDTWADFTAEGTRLLTEIMALNMVCNKILLPSEQELRQQEPIGIYL